LVWLFFFQPGPGKSVAQLSFAFCGEAGSVAKYSVLTLDVAELPAATADRSFFLPVLF